MVAPGPLAAAACVSQKGADSAATPGASSPKPGAGDGAQGDPASDDSDPVANVIPTNPGGGGAGGAGTAAPGTAAPGDGTAGPAAGRRAAGNPFAGAKFYVSGDYAALVKQGAASLAGDEQKRAATVAAQPTAVWLDRIAAIAGGANNGGRLGLAAHLDAALVQAGGSEIVLALVVYDLPMRDCKAKASNGELQAGDLGRYKSEYIDRIAATLASKPDYQKVRVVVLLEPDSLPNMVTNSAGPSPVPACQQVAAANLYTDGIAYALGKFKALANVYVYLDIAHAGWLGWPEQKAKAVDLYADLISAAGGTQAVRGLATNIANFTPVLEPHLSPSDQATVSGKFYEYNPNFDEKSFVADLAKGFAAKGLGGLGFVIDTSRNGWPDRTDGPIDRRLARGNWCNIRGSGLGPRPQAAPAGMPAVDAFFWVKPPGESDGYGALQNPTNAPDAEGKRFDADCDASNAAQHGDSLAGAPSAGRWFQGHFEGLLRQATPSL